MLPPPPPWRIPDQIAIESERLPTHYRYVIIPGSYLAARTAIVAHARKAPGCLDFALGADLLDPGRVNVYERWRSHEDLLAYRAGDGPDLDDRIPLAGANVELHHISASQAP